VSYTGQTLKAATEVDGASGGKVRLKALEILSGGLRVFFPGQNGGDGLAGVQGSPGQVGNRGANAVDGLGFCKSGGQDGGIGEAGSKGGTGHPGGKGGDGGELVLEAIAAKNSSLIDFQAPAGLGGQGGSGEPGGPGGPGGSGSAFCGGGHGGSAGPAGPAGDPGSSGTRVNPEDASPENGELTV
jgi:hypothetical protein